MVLLSDGKTFYNRYLQMSYYKVGLDIGSTTAKMVVLDEQNSTVFQRYERHQAKVNECLRLFFGQLNEQLPADAQISLCITGSVGMGVAEKCGFQLRAPESSRGGKHDRHRWRRRQGCFF